MSEVLKVLITFPLDDGYVEEIATAGVEAKRETSESEIEKIISDFDVLYATSISKTAFKLAKKLKWIQSPYVGVDSLLIEEVRNSNVIVTSSKGIHSIQASEHVFSMILAYTRRLNEIFEEKKMKIWKSRHPFPFEPLDEVNGKTIGIIGVGSIGREIARKAKCFGMKVLGVKRNPEKIEFVDEVYGVDGLETVLMKSDFLVICAPKTDETVSLISEKEFKLMKKSACLINIARGGIVDENALIRALKEGWISFACLDVFSEEPLRKDSPLWEMDNVIITPHVAGSSPYYWDRAVEIFKENLKRFKEGRELINVVDKELGY